MEEVPTIVKEIPIIVQDIEKRIWCEAPVITQDTFGK